ncbi:CPBP family intramembrane metalloprotease [Halorussus gelatinilyticus]|uniref:CPBP family intramembrane metalloprotease n=1 Tax=Halorussus gelatinilyticus TaxID=2937524 RepID=A0A8U0IKC0_9EURY|nr:type II CAAX endopeptidase family protein [Halorussus gelatinilyticus]UPW01587.1 CPBP family intramembrane metalloprotease [Halorussus gelatinilyticus]
MSHPSVDSARRVGVATGLTALGAVFGVLLSIPVSVVPLGTVAEFAVALVLSELGFVAAGLVFLRATGNGLDFFRIRTPGLRALGFVVAGTVALFAYRLVAILGVQALGLPLAGNSVTRLAREGVLATLLLLVPLSVVVIGPAEEFLFRGVVQSYLDGAFSRGPAVVLTSVLFALVHLPTTWIATPDPVAVSVTLAILFGLSILLGYLYVWTDNLVVPMLVHGFYDALLFGLAYLVLSSDLMPEAAAAVSSVLPP